MGVQGACVGGSTRCIRRCEISSKCSHVRTCLRYVLRTTYYVLRTLYFVPTRAPTALQGGIDTALHKEAFILPLTRRRCASRSHSLLSLPLMYFPLQGGGAQAAQGQSAHLLLRPQASQAGRGLTHVAGGCRVAPTQPHGCRVAPTQPHGYRVAPTQPHGCRVAPTQPHRVQSGTNPAPPTASSLK